MKEVLRFYKRSCYKFAVVWLFQPDTEGFLAMLLPRKPEHSSEMRRLVTADEYERLLAARKTTVD